MQLGMIGLGRMGANMVRRLIRGGHQCVALFEQPDLETFSGRVSDSGEGRWTVTAAIDEGAPAPVLSAALYQRFASRGKDDYATRVLSAMRHKFGGHVERATGG